MKAAIPAGKDFSGGRFLRSVRNLRVHLFLMHSCVFISSLAIMLMASSTTIHAAHTCIEAAGNAHITRVTTDGHEIPSATYSAPVSVILADDGRFIIELFNHNFYKRRQITFSFDGTNYFYVIGDGTNISSNARFESHGAMAYLSAEEMPLIMVDDPARNALWYALCSGNYFKKHGLSGEILELFQSPRRSVIGYGYRYEVALTNAIFSMPHRLDVWRDKKYDKEGRVAEESRIELNAIGRGSALYDNEWYAKTAIPDGSHSLNLVWNRDYLLRDQRLPLEVEITDFYTERTNTRPCLKIILKFEPWHLATVGNQTFRPPDPTGPMRVQDARVRIREGAHYLDELSYSLGTSLTNSKWYPTNDPWIQEGIRVISKAQTIPGSHRNLGLFALVLIGLIAPVFVYLLLSKKRT